MKNQVETKNNASIKLYVFNIGALFTGIDLSNEIYSFDLKIINYVLYEF